MNHEFSRSTQLDESDIDKVGHIIDVSRRSPEDEGFNPKVEVFSPYNEGDRAQVYQMYAVGKFVENPVALRALEHFGIAGDNELEQKEKWTQLLEHIAGVTAIATRIEALMVRHGATPIDPSDLDSATMFDSLQKPGAVQIVADDKILETATTVHDIEKPAEVAVSGGGGLENSLDNPVLRDGALWRWLDQQGVDETIIEAAQNTGRDDRFYSDYADYTGDTVKKAIRHREKLAHKLGVSTDIVDDMTPSERRQASIEAKGRLAAVVGVSDAMAAQFKFQGLTNEGIDQMTEYYLERKTDPESVAFFGRDWPEYYKQVREYLVNQVPEASRSDFNAELAALTHEDIFSDTVLPYSLGDNNPEAKAALSYN